MTLWQQGWLTERRAVWLALVLGVLLVGLFDAALTASRYPYAADSASYIEMAATLASDGRPRVTPWDLTPSDRDAIPQRLFPPGFAALIAAFIPVTGDARTAALIPSRVAAMLLPLLIVVLWRRLAPPAVLLGAGLWVLSSPGVRQWQFIAYSDVLALALAVLALGLLARLAVRAAAGTPARLSHWLGAGCIAGLCYPLRNAGIAVLVAAAATLAYACLRGRLPLRAALAWALGTTPPLALLAAYNLATFGSLQPYTMPRSERGLVRNLFDYAGAQLEDLGVPWIASPAAPAGLPLALIALLLGAGGWLWWRTRGDSPRHFAVTLLGSYAVSGGVLLVASRSTFEWGNLIDTRNTLQYSFAIALAIVIGGGGIVSRRTARIAGALLAGLLAVTLATAAREAYAVGHGPAEEWLALSRDPAVLAAASDLPAAVLTASNYSILFRISAAHPTRQLDVGGDDAALAGSLALLRASAGGRPAMFLLVCDREWTAGFSACQAHDRPGGSDCVRVRKRHPYVARCTPAASAPDERGPLPQERPAREPGTFAPPAAS